MTGRKGKRDSDGMDVEWSRPDPSKDGMDPDVQFARRAQRLLGMHAARWMRIGIIGLLIVIIYFQMNPVAAQVKTPKTDLDPSGRAESWALTEQWLKDDPLGGDARIVSWDGQERVELADGSDRTVVSVNTLIVDSRKGWWRVRTTMRPDGTMAGWPAAERIEISTATSPNSADTWPDTLASLTPSETLSTAVSKWADAYMGSDSALLTTLMHDPDANASYQAQALGRVSSATIEKAAYLDAGRVDKNGGKSDRAAARVTIVMEAASMDAKQTQFSYDLLLSDPDGTPSILAWGAPGTGAGLTERMNRLPGGTKATDPETATDAGSGTDAGDATGAGASE